MLQDHFLQMIFDHGLNLRYFNTCENEPLSEKIGALSDGGVVLGEQLDDLFRVATGLEISTNNVETVDIKFTHKSGARTGCRPNVTIRLT